MIRQIIDEVVFWMGIVGKLLLLSFAVLLLLTSAGISKQLQCFATKSGKVVEYLLVDESNSMNDYKYTVITKVNERLRLLPLLGETHLVFFGNKNIHKCLISGQVEKMPYNITKTDYKPFGNSPIRDAMIYSIKEIEDMQPDIAELIVISDFEDSGSKSTEEDLAKVLNNTDVRLIKENICPQQH